MQTRGHGGDIYALSREDNRALEDIIDFSANINPLGIPQAMKEAMRGAIDKCEAYPDPQCRRLIEAITQFEKVPYSFITCGNGAADIIFRLVYAIRPKKAMLLAPTFSEYEEALRAVEAELCYYLLQEKEQFKVTEAILECMDDTIDMLFICNPNNPTGQVTEKALLEKILKKCEKHKILLVIDECFNDFLEEPDIYTMKALLQESEYLFILKAFTKMYAIPGVRLGYGMTSNQEICRGIEASGQAWSVSVIAQEAGIWATQEEDYVLRTKKLIAQERTYLKQQLEQIGMRVYEPFVNYIFFKNPYGIDLSYGLRKQGILIRSCSNYNGLDKQYYRVAIKTHQLNEKLIEAFRKILNR